MKVLAISACVLGLLTGVALSQDGENANTIADKQNAAAYHAMLAKLLALNRRCAS